MSNFPKEIVFAPGCFDNFEGTQEELEKFISDLQEMVASGELFKRARLVLEEELTDEIQEKINQNNRKKKLN